jgi:hypothetical protein
MPSWGNKDAAANAPLWAVTTVNLKPDSANTADFYNDNTKEDFKVTLADGSIRLANTKVGLFLVDNAEEQVFEATPGAKPAHSGWSIRKEGYGGRANRVTWETLIALASPLTDNTFDTLTPDALITISQPITLGGPVSAAGANVVTFSVAGTTVVPSSAALTYQWQVNNNSGGSWVNIDPGTGVTTGQPGSMTKTGANTATLLLDPTGTAANNYVFRCLVTATNPGITNSAASAYSANARILITA